MSPAAARSLALCAVLAGCLAAAPLRRFVETPPPPRACAPEGRGEPPRGWIGCAADPGPARPLTGGERLALGLPVDPNRASAAELARVPGLSPAIAAEIVRDREARGPFSHIGDLERVRGIGPARLARAAASLEVVR